MTLLGDYMDPKIVDAVNRVKAAFLAYEEASATYITASNAENKANRALSTAEAEFSKAQRNLLDLVTPRKEEGQ
jgi:outer membrane protein TolC